MPTWAGWWTCWQPPGPGGGRRDLDATVRYFAPTVVADVGWDDPLMQEEIFGPILPVVAYDDYRRGLWPTSTARDKPLALYLYSRRRRSWPNGS